MTISEPLDRRIWRTEDELNRLAGTLVNGMPTLGKATAALWWLGHRELTWASHNMLTPNQATGGMSTGDTAGFVPLDGQTLEVVESDPLIGNLALQITSVPQPDPKEAPPEGGTTYLTQDSRIAFEDPIPVQPWHIYTASMYTRKEPGGDSPSRANWMTLHWFDDTDTLISSFEGDFHVSKDIWNLTWVTTHAPENAATCRVSIRWEQMPGEVFSIDKAIFYNGSDPQAWAFPGAGGFDLEAGLRAHLNMKAGIFNPDDFLTAEEAGNRIANRVGAELALALSTIPTPDRDVVAH